MDDDDDNLLIQAERELLGIRNAIKQTRGLIEGSEDESERKKYEDQLARLLDSRVELEDRIGRLREKQAPE